MPESLNFAEIFTPNLRACGHFSEGEECLEVEYLKTEYSRIHELEVPKNVYEKQARETKKIFVYSFVGGKCSTG